MTPADVTQLLQGAEKTDCAYQEHTSKHVACEAAMKRADGVSSIYTDQEQQGERRKKPSVLLLYESTVRSIRDVAAEAAVSTVLSSFRTARAHLALCISFCVTFRLWRYRLKFKRKRPQITGRHWKGGRRLRRRKRRRKRREENKR